MTLPPQFTNYLPKAIWLIPIIFFGWIIFRYTAVSGNYTYVWIPGDQPEFNLQPLGRVSKPLQQVDTGEVFQQISGDPVYLSVNVPRSFESVVATLNIENHGQPLIEFGVQDNADVWHFTLHPLDVPMLDDLNWVVVTDTEGSVLFQKQPTFNSITDFLANLPLDQRIAEYHQSLQPPFVMDEYVQQPSVDIQTPLRGSHTLKMYVQDQLVGVALDFQDLNRGFDDDAVTMTLLQAGQVLAETSIGDDGDLVADGQISSARSLELTTPSRVTGVVELQITSTDDLLIRRLNTNVGYLVTRQLYLAASSEYGQSTTPTVLTTNALSLQGTTAHPAGLQSIIIDEEVLPLEKLNSPTHIEFDDDRSRTITSPQNDVTLVSQGWMSFTPDSFFDPDYQIEQLTPATDLEQINFIYAADLPQHTVTENIRTVEFDLTQVPGDKKHLNFVLSAPGLDQRKADYSVSSIRFEFHRPPLTLGGIWQRIKQRLNV